jgi:transglutaminase-like putative cysteine protease
MQRTLTSTLELDVTVPATLALQIAVADDYRRDDLLTSEQLDITVDGAPIPHREHKTDHGTRLHVVQAAVGRVRVNYRAEVRGRAAATPTDEVDLLRYLRPSRYAESDSLGPTSHSEFAGLTGNDLLNAVTSWVGTRLTYVPGSSDPTDGAVHTLLARQGVCRDYAHLVVALLRAVDVPARLVAVYAPGLEPMDFHAVAEAHVEGEWRVVDATALAPRSSLVRIATGLDASDTAFLSVHHGRAELLMMEVGAVVDELPGDDLDAWVGIG